jgi:hypothetical protein
MESQYVYGSAKQKRETGTLKEKKGKVLKRKKKKEKKKRKKKRTPCEIDAMMSDQVWYINAARVSCSLYEKNAERNGLRCIAFEGIVALSQIRCRKFKCFECRRQERK